MSFGRAGRAEEEEAEIAELAVGAVDWFDEAAKVDSAADDVDDEEDEVEDVDASVVAVGFDVDDDCVVDDCLIADATMPRLCSAVVTIPGYSSATRAAPCKVNTSEDTSRCETKRGAIRAEEEEDEEDEDLKSGMS